LFGVLLTLLVTTVLDTVLTQLEWSHQQQVASQNALQQQKLENQRAEAARELAEQQSQDESLQTYLGDMGELILRDTSPLRGAEPGSEVSTLARAKTLTVLARLDPARKSGLLQFLVEAELVQGVEGRAPVITLSGTDLSSADLRYPEVGGANLSGATLSFANLSDADLSFANLSDADLEGADLEGADLEGAQGVTKEQIEQQAASLKGAIMPDGSKPLP
jgi:uncharacterized protein YjbI with pentapeptide repeats